MAATKKKNNFQKTLQTTSKQLIWLFSINGILWIWCSYLLAFMGKDQIAESLSSNVCTVVLGQMGMYLITKTMENVFKFNNGGLFGTSNEQELHDEKYIDIDGDGIPDVSISELVEKAVHHKCSDGTAGVIEDIHHAHENDDVVTENTSDDDIVTETSDYSENGGVDPTAL